MEFNTRYPKTLRSLEYTGGNQAWRDEDLGYTSVINTITGHIFEFGFTDAILQMWAAFCLELDKGPSATPFGCVTPEETTVSHELFTAALLSQKENKVVVI
jgi:hypothetical protein